MADLYFLAFRDIASASTGVTAGEVYVLRDVAPAMLWATVGLTGASWVPWDQVAGVFHGKRVCFVVHGFNVDAGHGIKSGGPAAQEFEALGQLGLAMTAADIVVTVLWPGDGLIGWSWFTAFGHAETTGARFADFLTSSAVGAAEVSFISHSLGARVVLETITQTDARNLGVVFDTAILTAAAVDDTALDAYPTAAAALRRIVVISSTQDHILKLFFTLGDLAESVLWSSYDGDSRALGRFGPKFKTGSSAPAKTEWYEIRPAIGQDHGDYLPAGGTAPLPGGWTDKRRKVSEWCRDLFDQRPPEPELTTWATDNTARFRPGWPAKF
jgi:hypothetical protein